MNEERNTATAFDSRTATRAVSSPFVHESLFRAAQLAVRLLQASVCIVCALRPSETVAFHTGDAHPRFRALPQTFEGFLRLHRDSFVSDEAETLAPLSALTSDKSIQTSIWQPLQLEDGILVGWLCVADKRPRTWSADDKDLVRIVSREFGPIRSEKGVGPTPADAEQTVAEFNSGAALREHHDVFSRITDGFVALDRNWRYTYVNDTAASLFGRRPQEMLGRHIWTEFPEGVGQPFYHAYHQALQEQRSITLEDYYEPWDRWFENRIYPSEAGLSIYFSEITERKRSERQLRDSENLFRILYDTSLTGFLRHTPDGTILDANPTMVNLLGWPLDDLRRIPYQDLLPEEKRAEEIARLNELPPAGRFGPLSSEYVHRDGRRIPVRVTGTVAEHHGQKFVWLSIDDISAREQAKKALTESEQRFRTTFELSASGKALVALDGRWLQVNQKLCDIVGYSRYEMLTKTFQEITYPEDLETDLAYIQQLLANEIASYSMEKRYVRRNGSLVWIDLTVALVKNAEGVAEYFIADIQDISARKCAEAKLQASEHHLRDVLNSLFAFVGVMTPDGILREANDAALRVAHLQPEDVLGKPLVETYWLAHSPAVQARMQHAIEQALAGLPQRYDEVIRIGDQQFLDIDFTICAMCDEAGQVTHLVPSAVDITERKRGESLLAREALRWRILFEQAKDAMFVIDESGRVTEANHSFAAMLGCSMEEVLTLYPKDWDASYATQKKPGAHWPEFPTVSASFESLIRRRNGELFDAELSYSPAEWEGKKQLFFMCRDVTARKQAEKRLTEFARQLELLSQKVLTTQEAERRHIARELHDEIGQLLTVIKLDLRSILRHAQAQPFVSTVTSALAIVDELVAHVRNLSLDLHPSILDDLGLVPALRWYSQRQEPHFGFPIVLSLAADNDRLPAAIEAACFRIVQEALTNAARHARATRVEIALEVTDENVSIAIQDNGVGFDIDHVRRGTSFGTGFGLLSMQERAQLVGGCLDLSSARGKGAEIKATFPLRPGSDS